MTTDDRVEVEEQVLRAIVERLRTALTHLEAIIQTADYRRLAQADVMMQTADTRMRWLLYREAQRPTGS